MGGTAISLAKEFLYLKSLERLNLKTLFFLRLPLLRPRWPLYERNLSYLAQSQMCMRWTKTTWWRITLLKITTYTSLSKLNENQTLTKNSNCLVMKFGAITSANTGILRCAKMLRGLWFTLMRRMLQYMRPWWKSWIKDPTLSSLLLIWYRLMAKHTHSRASIQMRCDEVLRILILWSGKSSIKLTIKLLYYALETMELRSMVPMAARKLKKCALPCLLTKRNPSQWCRPMNKTKTSFGTLITK